MVKISYTKVQSQSAKHKGQWYPRMYIKSTNWDKAIKPTYKNILFFRRANTKEKQSQNKKIPMIEMFWELSTKRLMCQ